MPNKRQVVLFAVILLLVIAGSVFANTESGLRVTFIDVGQGDAILLRSPDRVILIDAGDDRANAAHGAIIPYLRKEGISKIDTLVISHHHRDHYGGMLDLLPAVEVGQILYGTDRAAGPTEYEEYGGEEGDLAHGVLYSRITEIIKQKQIPYTQVKIGDILDFGAHLKVELFHAPEIREWEDGSLLNENNGSLIFKVSFGKISYLFTGDAERAAEEAIVRQYGSKLRSTVLKVAHHGSRTSSINSFLELVQPHYGIISVGERNPFGHPSAETLEKFDYHKIKHFRTDRDGTIESFTDGKTVKFVTNSSPLEFVKNPAVISLTETSATLQWETNKKAGTRVDYGVQGSMKTKENGSFVQRHTITLTDLKPGTEYQFNAVSVDERQPDQVVEFSGKFKTPEGTGIVLPRIASVLTPGGKLFMKAPFTTRVVVNNDAEVPGENLRVALYHTAIDAVYELGSDELGALPAGSTNNCDFSVTFTWKGRIEMIAVLYQGDKILDTRSTTVDIDPRLMLVDCAHGNIDYYTGRYAGMKMDLFNNLGVQMKSFSKAITPDLLKDASIVAISTPRKDFAPGELVALRNFTAAGGSLILYSRSDFRDLSNPRGLNMVLEAVGSGIRFNDDQFADSKDNIGPPFRAFVRNFPSEVTQGNHLLLVRNSGTLTNNRMTGLKASKHIHLVATGGETSYNMDSDGNNDAYLYASHTPLLPVPVVAAENLGTGRLICVGEPMYDESYYANPSTLTTPVFNRQLISWLIKAQPADVSELLSYAESLQNSAIDPELQAVRIEAIKQRINQIARDALAENPDQLESIMAPFSQFTGDLIEVIKQGVTSQIRFNQIHR